MSKTVKEYKAGDFIFAKVKGYPAWPARVQKMVGKKYLVYFYGTGETANLPPNMIFNYVENKDKFLSKKVKRRDFNDGVEQIKFDFANNVPIEQVLGVPAEAPANTSDSANESAASVDNTTIDDSKANQTANTTQSDTGIEDSDEAGALVIDEGKKAKKGKLDTKDKETPKPAKVIKSSRGRSKKEEDENKEDEEIVSSRGRKIRPKRYLDEQTEENATLPHPTKKRRAASPPPEIEKKEVKAKKIKPFNNVAQSELENIREPLKQDDAEKHNILIAYLPSGRYVGISLFQSRPVNFKNEAARLMWDKQAAASAISLKLQLEGGLITEESVRSQLVTNLNLTDEERDILDLEREAEEKRSHVHFLKTEMKLIELDSKIKACLSLEKADTDECLKLLDELMDLNVKGLMLIKHPTCLETIKRMRAYVGNTPSWELSESAALLFSKQALKIREQAVALYNDFKDLFIMPEGLTFWEYFSDRVRQFKKVTAHLSTDELLKIVQEPLEMAQPNAHTMQAAVAAVNDAASPLEDDVTNKKNASGKEKKSPDSNSQKTTTKRQPIGKHSDDKGKAKKMKCKEENLCEEDETSDYGSKTVISDDEAKVSEEPKPDKGETRDKSSEPTGSDGLDEAKAVPKEDPDSEPKTTAEAEKSSKSSKESTQDKDEKRKTGRSRSKLPKESKKTELPSSRSQAKKKEKK